MSDNIAIVGKGGKTCWLCGSTEWLHVDYLRREPQEMVVCKGCGLITFNRFSDDQEYKVYYEEQYRDSKAVSTSNLVTTNRKLGYHEIFLGPWFKEKNKKGLVVGEIGAGTGYFLNWTRQVYGASIYGSELTSTFRRYAKWSMEVDLTQEFDFNRKYDLIAIYHTLEHIPDPKALLLKLRECLNPDGVLYIATPVWMGEMKRWGGGQFNGFDEHFHPDHINAWSLWHLNQLFSQSGWKPLKESSKLYGHTVLLTPETSFTKVPPLPSPPQKATDVEVQLLDMKRAATVFQRGDFAEAMRLYPRFVDAYLASAGMVVNNLQRQMELHAMGEKACPDSCEIPISRGLLLYQYNHYAEAEVELMKAMTVKPHDDNVLRCLAMIHLRRGEIEVKKDIVKGKEHFQKAITLLDKLIGINPTQYQQCYDIMAYIFSITPLDGEQAEIDSNKFVSPHCEGEGIPYIDIKAAGAGG